MVAVDTYVIAVVLVQVSTFLVASVLERKVSIVPVQNERTKELEIEEVIEISVNYVVFKDHVD